jgi:hypothetical protein
MVRQRLVAAAVLGLISVCWWSVFIARQRAPAVDSAVVTVRRSENTVSFPGVVTRDKGWVQFLIYAPGYRWLEQECAITAMTSLISVQNAVAGLDWKVWEDLWAQRKRVPGIDVWITHDGVRHRAQDLVFASEELHLKDLLFVGSPYFDAVALDPKSAGICAACPLYPVEQEFLKQEAVRESGRSGYELNQERMPAPGARVEITLRLPPR